jgi:GTP-binding protein Era
VGKPNVGKSTLLNALVGQKISITSRKAQTTRHRITGIRTLGPDAVRVRGHAGLPDAPLHGAEPVAEQDRVGAMGDVDLVLFVVEAGNFTLADAKVLSLLKPGTPALLVANKLDKVHRRAEIAPWLQATCRSATRSPNSCPCRPRMPSDVERLLASARNTCPSRPGGTARTS